MTGPTAGDSRPGGLRVEVRDLTVRYGDTVALDGVDLTFEAGTITALLGRNGSGKTSLLSVLASYRRATSGTVLVGGAEPWEDEHLMGEVCLVSETGAVLSDYPLRDTLAFVSGAREHWSDELAGRLLDLFELDQRKKVSAFSRGKQSAVAVVIGLATRAPLTLLDEVHLGMDAPSRYAFYDALLADYVEHPRTLVLSSHLVDEVQRLVENVVILHEGRVLVSDEAEALRGRGTTVTGPTDAVGAFSAGRTVIGRQELGRTAQVTVYGDLAADDVAAARAAGLDLGPVDLQDLFVHLTGPTGLAQEARR